MSQIRANATSEILLIIIVWRLLIWLALHIGLGYWIILSPVLYLDQFAVSISVVVTIHKSSRSMPSVIALAI